MTPLTAKRPAIFYGWWIVISSSVIMLYCSGIIHFGFTAVFEPIASEFGWSYTQISLAASLRGLETGLIAPLLGWMVDRWGPRKLVFGGAIVTGLGMVWLGRINSLGGFYGAFFVIGIGLTTSSHGVMMPAVANWFRRRLGAAIGIMASGAALGGLLVPVVAVSADILGWRMAMTVMGLGVMVLVLPLSLLIRDRPDKYGYLPDGDTQPSYAPAGPGAPGGAVMDGSFKEALKSRAFWQIAGALGCQSIVVSAVLTHVMPYLSSIGVSRTTSSLAASALPVVSILGRLSFGWIGDKFDKRRVSAAGFALTTIGLLLFAFVGAASIWLLIPFMVIFGVGYGGNVTLRPGLLREQFGLGSFGAIHGSALGLMHLGAMVGAPFAGWVFDEWRSYQGAWLALAGLTGVAMLAIVSAPGGRVEKSGSEK